jgi:hypothetical protein
MPAVIYAFLSTLGALFRSQPSLRVENVALRHQLAIYRRTVKRPSVHRKTESFGLGCRVAGQGGGNGKMLKPIIDTIDRYGLKRHFFLVKHKKDAPFFRTNILLNRSWYF